MQNAMPHNCALRGTFKIPLCSQKLIVKNSSDEYSKELSLKERNVQTIQAILKSKVQISKTKSGNMANIGNFQWSNKAPSEMKWIDAVDYCNNLNEGGYSNWRLPNIDELKTLIGEGQSKLGDTGWFWSSSIRSDYSNNAGVLNFYNGIVNYYSFSYNNYVRCVRGGD